MSGILKRKKRPNKIMSSALHTHKEMVSKLGKNGKKELYNRIKFIMFKDEQRKGASIKLKSENGLFVTDENDIVFLD